MPMAMSEPPVYPVMMQRDPSPSFKVFHTKPPEWAIASVATKAPQFGPQALTPTLRAPPVVILATQTTNQPPPDTPMEAR